MINKVQPSFTSRITMSYDTSVRINNLPKAKKQSISNQIVALEHNYNSDIVELFYNDKMLPVDVLELRVLENHGDKVFASLVHPISISKIEAEDSEIIEAYNLQRGYLKKAQNNKFIKYV